MGELFIVPTPIGNLEDITLRGIRILKEVDLVLAEDTRTSRKLLQHYEIETPLQSFHIHNEHKVVERYVDDLLAGRNIALVSDAGTPAISDPGFLLIRSAYAKNVKVTCLPGASAIIPAVVGSGFPCDRFVFEGFLPHKKGRQSKWLVLTEEERTIVLYESPHRLLKCLREIDAHFGEQRLVCVAREISKFHEEFKRGTAKFLVDYFENKGTVKGEIVIVIAQKEER
ncbi:MAG: 16S rRNA (cytidine(1402)-2'-O)-methyltransferase [Crocinitomicaceae bacterium]|nr:16S rRNA (cytidine(1402)-2'-O)-methyltransferase [Crocinitomicaceae bacterium]